VPRRVPTANPWHAKEGRGLPSDVQSRSVRRPRTRSTACRNGPWQFIGVSAPCIANPIASDREQCASGRDQSAFCPLPAVNARARKSALPTIASERSQPPVAESVPAWLLSFHSVCFIRV